MSPQYLKHRLIIFALSQLLSSGRQRPLRGQVISLHGNSCIRVLGEPRDTEVTFATWVYTNMVTHLRFSQNIDKCLVIFIIKGLQGKDFGNC